MSAEEVEVSVGEGIGWIAFNRPQASNAVRPEMMRHLCAALDALDADDSVQAIVLTGNGRHFSAGADFDWLEELLETKTEEIRDSLYRWFVGAARRLWRCSKPTIAAVNGAAVTVGCELSLMCDIRLACESTAFHESWLKLGLLPPLGGAVLLPRLIGLGRATEMILEARQMRGSEAVQIGLASELVDEDLLRRRAAEKAQALLQFPARSYRLAKEALRRPLDADMEREWQANVMAQSLLLNTEEFARRVRELKNAKRPTNAR